MRIFNKAKTKELKTYDLEKGYLKEDVIINHYEEVLAVEEQSHKEVVAEYPNGGKDVITVIDVPGVAYQPARDEEEKIMIYIPYTQKELAKMQAEKRIAELKQLLKDSDYRAIKYAEGMYSEDDYRPYRELRNSYRKEINELEAQIGE